ncbi:MAG: phage baseplate assembly protein V [Acidobacteriota bacterium]
MTPDPSTGCQDPNQDATPEAPGRFYGKYRGEVIENDDLEARGRILAIVPAIPGSLLNWAMPCVPYGGEAVGFYSIPPIGANVWIEFEGGNPSYPIWSGCFWEEGEFPEPMALDPADAPLVKMWRTAFSTFVMNDTPAEGGIILETSEPAVEVPDPITMTFSTLGVEINCGISQMLMSPEEGITLTVGDSTILINEEGITMNGPAIQIEADANINATAGAAVEIEGGGDVSVTAGGAAEVTAGGDVSIAAAGAAEVSAAGDVAVSALGACEVSALGDLALSALGAAELSALGDCAISALGACEVSALGDCAVSALGACEVTALADVAITGITQMLTGLVEVNGDLLIDGQQPLVV